HQDLVFSRAVRRLIVLALALAEERNELLRGVELVVLDHVAADLLREEEVAVGPMVGGRPDAFLIEDDLARFAADVVTINDVRSVLYVVGMEINILGIVGDEVEDGLNVGLVLDERERAALRVLQVDARVLFAVAIAADDDVFPVG